ncbi:plasmolipin-like [Watersipora subatra]|uniref:plasmolipin-like n=1 Tax=Watersipora subatra TaxID=2589382 RepID=UPI00355BAA84
MMDETYDKSAPPPEYTDAGNYSAHTTTTTTTERATLFVNKDYIKTIPGILKLVQALSSLICLICGSVSNTMPAGWLGFVAGWVFFFSLIWFFLYLFNLVAKIHPVRILVEWVYDLVLTILFLISSIVAAVYAAAGASILGAYAFFGFICTAALGVDLFLQFKVWRSEGLVRTTQSTTTTTVTSAGTTEVTDIRY